MDLPYESSMQPAAAARKRQVEEPGPAAALGEGEFEPLSWTHGDRLFMAIRRIQGAQMQPAVSNDAGTVCVVLSSAASGEPSAFDRRQVQVEIPAWPLRDDPEVAYVRLRCGPPDCRLTDPCISTCRPANGDYLVFEWKMSC